MAKANQPTPQSARIPPDIPSDPGISSLLGAYLRNFALWCRDGFAEQMRNNQALPGVMLMGFNAPARSNPAVWLLQVGNGGTLWVTPMNLGSGDLGTPIVAQSTQFKSLIGVTDGSNAPAGQVGEFLVNSASGINIPNNTYVNITSINLTPGDWDVSGSLYVIPSAGSTNIQGGISTVSNGNTQDVVIVPGSALSYYRFAVPTKRINVTVTTPVYLVGFAVIPSGTTQGIGIIQARRMR